MGIIYEIQQTGDLIVGYGTGIITTDDFIHGLAKVSTQPGFRPGLDRCVLFDDSVSLPDLNFDNIRRLQDAAKKPELTVIENNKISHDAGYKLACVSSDEVKIASLKLYEALWKIESKITVEVMIFSNKKDALVWLGRADLKIADQPNLV